MNEYENESRTFAWILLSVSERGSAIADILATADGINCAVPTHRELHTSLSWLREQGLVRKDGRRYARTEMGSALLARVGAPVSTMTGWHLVARELQKMIDALDAADDITKDKIISGYEAHKQKLTQMYEEIKRRSAA